MKDFIQNCNENRFTVVTAFGLFVCLGYLLVLASWDIGGLLGAGSY